jgi:cytoskeletal protein CcmA (bactofilin family)
MSLFKKNKSSDNLDTLIGSKTIFEGVLISNKSICIEGTVKGKVECRGSVMIGQEGKAKVDIVAENALIGGQVNGNITTKNKLEITSAGRVKGDIETSRLVIAEGVVSADSKSTLKKGTEIEKNSIKFQVGKDSSLQISFDNINYSGSKTPQHCY